LREARLVNTIFFVDFPEWSGYVRAPSWQMALVLAQGSAGVFNPEYRIYQCSDLPEIGVVYGGTKSQGQYPRFEVGELVRERST
jgi:hypothetical protein